MSTRRLLITGLTTAILMVLSAFLFTGHAEASPAALLTTWLGTL